MTSLVIQLIGEGSRGSGTGEDELAGLHIGIQRGSEVVDLASGGAPKVTFRLSIDVREADDGTVDVRGPYVHGKRGDRFLYLSWGEVDRDGGFGMVMRTKIKLQSISLDLIARALESGSTVRGMLSLLDAAGKPVLGTAPPERLQWVIIGGAGPERATP